MLRSWSFYKIEHRSSGCNLSRSIKVSPYSWKKTFEKSCKAWFDYNDDGIQEDKGLPKDLRDGRVSSFQRFFVLAKLNEQHWGNSWHLFFNLVFAVQLAVKSECFLYNCRWLDSNPGPQEGRKYPLYQLCHNLCPKWMAQLVVVCSDLPFQKMTQHGYSGQCYR